MNDYRVAIVVNPDLSAGYSANTVATLSAGLGARFPLLLGGKLNDAAGLEIDVSSKLPIAVLQASSETLQQLLAKSAGSSGMQSVVVFPAFARQMHDFNGYAQQFSQRQLAQEPLDGIALCGPAQWVKSLTGALKLLR
ncbi:DUF2000 domain-containing protein [Pantoea sp. B65]|uniref:DUF2000 domain-containing protein n=1 Tax=Pantoea sp. B65 TaxID=2813359 RepID=UPI0039B56C43